VLRSGKIGEMPHWAFPMSAHEWLKTREKIRPGGLPIVYRILLLLRLRE